jgi:hypothetical protein
MSNCYCHPGRAGGSPHPLGGSLSENGILKTLRQLVAMQLSINLEEISPETRIPHDLDIY